MQINRRSEKKESTIWNMYGNSEETRSKDYP